MTKTVRSDSAGRAPEATSGPASFDEVVEVRFRQSELASELVSATLWTSGCEGSIFDDDGADVIVTAWFPESSRREALEALNAIDGVAARIDRRERLDWLEHYEQSLTPLLIGQRFVIAPKADLVEGTARIAIVVPQEQAFGTGSHESTAMCLELLEHLDMKGARCLDVGTGSGILAIAMAKLGAGRVFAFDNDVATWGVIDRNLERNDVADGRIRIFYASAEALLGGRFDVVTMNILPHVIIELLPHIVPVMSPGAALIVSGILLTQRHDVIGRSIASGLTLDHELQQGEWWAATLRTPAN
jgi:ribosomal protein L11 methyltransferase